MTIDRKETGLAAQLAPVGRETVQDRVYQELRRALICGVFESGQILTVRGLADVLLTSTMPVREALGRLVVEQALEALPNRSVRVPLLTIERLDDLLRARILVEGEVAALAVSKMSDEEIGAVRQIHREWNEMRREPTRRDVDREVRLNQSFHFAIYRHCGSAALLPVVESLWLQSGPCTRHAIINAVRMGDIDNDRYHERIVTALEARDAIAVRELIIADIARSFIFLRQELETGKRES